MKYRKDIDGLRGIAVMLFFCYHLCPQYLPGGLIGVDIFFVISGYLISSVIIRGLINNNFSLAGFYIKRIRRILPLLIVVILTVLIIGYILLLPQDYANLAESSVWTFSYLANIYFFKFKNNYFSQDSSELPLLHTWSLAVEEQFYIIWAISLIIIFKYISKPSLRLLLFAVIFISSLASSIYWLKYYPKLGYYISTSRAYELMIGASIVWLDLSQHSIRHTLHIAYRTILANLLAICGIIGIVLSVITTTKSEYPGYIALLPSFSAAAIIYAGILSKHSFINIFLKNHILVSLGLMSYSIYLWHFPIIAFCHYFALPINFKNGLAILLFTVALSMLTYTLIEQPMQQLKLKYHWVIILYVITPWIIITTTCYYIIHSRGYPNRFYPEEVEATKYLDSHYCHNHMTFNDCIFGDKLSKTKHNIILFGDSHAGNYTPFWEYIANNKHFQIQAISSDSCPPILDYKVSSYAFSDKFSISTKRCQTMLDYVMQNISNYDVFILAAAYDQYYDGKLKPLDFNFDEQLRHTLKFLQEHHKKVIIMGDFPNDMSGTIHYINRLTGLIHVRPDLSSQVRMESIPQSNIRLSQLATQYKNVYFFDSYNLIFKHITTLPYYNNSLIYRNDDHLNQHGAKLLANYFIESAQSEPLNKMLNKWGIIHQK